MVGFLDFLSPTNYLPESRKKSVRKLKNPMSHPWLGSGILKFIWLRPLCCDPFFARRLATKIEKSRALFCSSPSTDQLECIQKMKRSPLLLGISISYPTKKCTVRIQKAAWKLPHVTSNGLLVVPVDDEDTSGTYKQ